MTVFRVESARPGFHHAPGLVGDWSTSEEAREAALAVKKDSPDQRVTVTPGAEIPPPHDAIHASRPHAGGAIPGVFELDGKQYELWSEEGLDAWRQHYQLAANVLPHSHGHHFVPTGEPEEIT